MACLPGPPTFRLLDSYVGWDPAKVESLVGLDGPGLSLTPVDDATVSGELLAPHLPPPALAPGCDHCQWFLAAGPDCPHPGVLGLDRCSDGWRTIGPAAGNPGSCLHPDDAGGDRHIVAVAFHRHRLAVADRGRSVVEIVAAGDGRLLASVPFTAPAVLAFDPDGLLHVVAEQSGIIERFDPSGLRLGMLDPQLPAPIARLAVSAAELWMATEVGDRFRLWRANPDGSETREATLAELTAALPASSLVTASDSGFGLDDGGSTRRYDWCGRPSDGPATDPLGAELAPLGQLLTAAIDSGVPRCEWHRIRLEADVPTGTAVLVSLATSEIADPPPQGSVGIDPGWEAFDPGVPHPQDWQTVDGRVADALIRQPPGRFLFVRLRLTGDGRTSPTVRRIRLDFPRTTSLDSLPGIYREDPVAGEFTSRFLSLFDASLEEFDDAIVRHPALLDVEGVPADLLPWLASLLGVELDPSWTETTRRAAIVAAPELARRSGTPAGLAAAVRLVYGIDPDIEEPGRGQPWGAVGGSEVADRLGARLGETRLFSNRTTRLKIGSSPLGSAPLNSYGDPATDATAAGANRIRVLIPRTGSGAMPDRAGITALVNAAAPAHVVPEVVFAADQFRVGVTATVGVDTVFLPAEPAVLGPTTADPARSGKPLRLGGSAVLWPKPGRPSGGIALDGSTSVDPTVRLG